MTYAIKKGDFIVNMIIAHPSQVEELGMALGAELIDASKYGLTIGDYWDGTNWTRNVKGEQIILEPVELVVSIEDRVLALENSAISLEDALCEIDASNATAIAAIEDALCELDK